MRTDRSPRVIALAPAMPGEGLLPSGLVLAGLLLLALLLLP
ncbi:MAG TPA: hypothetical protein VM369_06710 [Candidatus Binatia bacterium]|nr:hypothetical protein [Candidatus Binatia bacterium]